MLVLSVDIGVSVKCKMNVTPIVIQREQHKITIRFSWAYIVFMALACIIAMAHRDHLIVSQKTNLSDMRKGLEKTLDTYAANYYPKLANPSSKL